MYNTKWTAQNAFFTPSLSWASLNVCAYQIIIFKKKKMSFFDIPDAQKICKGYFFEHKHSDLYRSSDESLCNESHPLSEEVNDGLRKK